MLSEKRSLNTYLFASTLLHHITIKNLILTIALFTTLVTSNILFSQTKRVAASARRAEYIEVEKGVKLHITDFEEGQPIGLIHGWPLSDEIKQANCHFFWYSCFPFFTITFVVNPLIAFNVGNWVWSLSSRFFWMFPLFYPNLFYGLQFLK